MTLTYSIDVAWSDEDNGYIALSPEFDGLSAFGATIEAASAELQIALAAALETYQNEGWALPEPRKRAAYSGKLLVRMPKSLHARLAQRAVHEGVSLNTLIVMLLAGRASE